ncbi:hypothetical protein [Streptomyces sp. NBC_01235]|uniref:hypothetical protein n=1 Tax=Streptomyces sp. NBC_01235 TaxID=2903788 RepID=UPI002E12B73B|nr:hypothetical protein OG289_26460 [Streptomyces sp. NBC_01235]
MPGTVLLLAASPAGKGRLVDAASVLPVLAAVPPSVLAGTDTANVVELADPLEPQAVLTRLRAAAAAPGPLTLFVAGQLQLDRRQRLPHLALARTTPSTVRYTALPWHWLREELRLRAAGATTVVLDLRADAEAWEWLRGNVLDCGAGVAVYGRVAQPPPAVGRGRRAVASPSYMKAVATILRSGGRPELERLHQMALARIGGDGETGDLVLFTPAPSPAPAAPSPSRPLGAAAPRPPLRAEGPRPQAPDRPSGDPHASISAAVQAGRHVEADAIAAQWEQAAAAAHGGGSEEALHWAEVRADLAMFAGDAERSCRTWMAVAVARLEAGQPVDAPAVEAAVDRAHHQWGRIGSAARARELGSALAELRGRVPGRREGALDHVQQQLRQLQTQG